MVKEIIRNGITKALSESPSGMPDHGKVEAFMRRHVCQEANKTMRTWSGKPPKKPVNTWHKSFVLTKTYDLCWSRPQIEIPEVILQMKIGGFHSKGQEIQELLSDVLYAGYDQILLNQPVSFYVCSVVFDDLIGKDEGWKKIKALKKPFYIILNPTMASGDRKSFSECIDVDNGVIRPTMKSHLNNIFGGNQAAKYIGLYRKVGQVEILVRPITFSMSDGRHTVLIWQVMNTCLTGSSQTLESWMP